MSTTAAEADLAAAAGVWVDQAAAARQRVTETATGAAQSAWLAFVGWYAAAAVTERAAAAAASSLSAQAMAAAALVQYVAQVTATLTGQRRVPAVAVEPPAVRNGADLTVVHARPARVYRETFALTGDVDLATRRAADRAVELTETDIMLAARQAELAAMERLQVKRYRRVLRPELSESGPCGLCVVAADRIYTIGELMPLHGRCKCEVMPLVAGADVGARLNREDLQRIYAAAGSTAAADLKRTRVQVNEHGELGPVLTVRGQTFTGPDDLGTPPAGRELREQRLAKLQNVLQLLEGQSADGQDVDDALAYQQRAIARTRRTLAA